MNMTEEQSTINIGSHVREFRSLPKEMGNCTGSKFEESKSLENLSIFRQSFRVTIIDLWWFDHSDR